MNKPKLSLREAGMMITIGAQGCGKTYQNMYVIASYVRDNVKTRVRGRKCLIFDTNGEYTETQFAENGIPNFNVRKLALKDVGAWSQSDTKECRRIDAKSLSIPEKKEVLKYLIKWFRNGLLVLEDINTYILSMTHMEDIVGGLVNLRHRVVDVLISYQRFRSVEPIILANSRWVRLHYQTDHINSVKEKVSSPEMFRIAQTIIENKYFSGDKRVFLYLYVLENKMEGIYTVPEFELACKEYLSVNKTIIKDHQQAHSCTSDVAVIEKVKRYKAMFHDK